MALQTKIDTSAHIRYIDVHDLSLVINQYFLAIPNHLEYIHICRDAEFNLLRVVIHRTFVEIHAQTFKLEKR
jgi:hypothetical protein